MVMKKIQWLAILLLINMPLFSMEQCDEPQGNDDAPMEEYRDESDYTSTEEYPQEEGSRGRNPNYQAYKFTAEKFLQASNLIRQNVVDANAAALIELYFTQHKDDMISKERWISIVKGACNYLPEAEFFLIEQELKFRKFQLLLEGIIED